MERNIPKIISKKGAALVFVIIALLVVSIMISVVAQIAQSNTKQASSQEKGIQVYYVAKSGAEMGFQAMMTSQAVSTSGSSIMSTMTKVGGYPPGIQIINILDDNNNKVGTATVTAALEDVAPNQKIVITSVGTLSNSNISKTVKLKFYVDYTNNKNIIWQ